MITNQVIEQLQRLSAKELAEVAFALLERRGEIEADVEADRRILELRKGTGEGTYRGRGRPGGARRTAVRLEFHPRFRTDLEEATRYYREQAGLELAEAFIEEVIQTIRQIENQPAIFPRTMGELLLHGIRRARLKRFKSYSIWYIFYEANQNSARPQFNARREAP